MPRTTWPLRCDESAPLVVYHLRAPDELPMPFQRSKQLVFQSVHVLKFWMAICDGGADRCAAALMRNEIDL